MNINELITAFLDEDEPDVDDRTDRWHNGDDVS